MKKRMILWSIIFLLVVSLLEISVIAKTEDKPLSSIFSIMTYNVLHGTKMDWEGTRKTIAAHLLKNYRPTIVGTQEGLDFQLDYLAEEINYSWFGELGYLEREVAINPYDAAILYDPTKAELEEKGTLRWPEVKTPGAAFILGWGKFKVKGYPTSIYVFNTHLFACDPPINAKQADLVYEVLSKIDPKYPVFLLGDFNARPGSYTWKKFTEGGFIDLWDAAEIKVGSARRIDWILCRLPEGERGFQRIEKVDYNENGTYPSDHRPIYVGPPPGIPEFEYSNLELSSIKTSAGEPLMIYVTVTNTGDAIGAIEIGGTEIELYIDGKPVDKPTGIAVEPGESKKAGITIKLYELGDHHIMVGTLGPKIVTVTETAPLF